MNKTTYANFPGVVNVFLEGGFIKSAFSVFGMEILRGDGSLLALHASNLFYSIIIVLHPVICNLEWNIPPKVLASFLCVQNHDIKSVCPHHTM